MSRRRKPDIVFTQPVQHHETPEERLYNSRKRTGLKASLGMASMLIGIGALLMFIFPLATAPIGFLGLILGVVAIGIKTAQRGIGHHMAMVGMLTSVVSLILACAFWIVSEQKTADEEKTRDEIQMQLTESISGVWKSLDDGDITIEFTPGGNIIYSKLTDDTDDAEALHEIPGLYSVTQREMLMAFGSKSTNFTYEILPNKQLRLMAPTDDDIRLGLGGNWRKIRALRQGVDYANASEDLRAYIDQLDEYTERKKTLLGKLRQFDDEKQTYVKRLKGHSGSRDAYRVLGKELKSVNEDITLVKERIMTLDMVIVRLQGVIRNEGREEDIRNLGMDEGELEDLLAKSFELEDKLKLDKEIEPLADREIEAMLAEAEEDDELTPVPQGIQ